MSDQPSGQTGAGTGTTSGRRWRVRMSGAGRPDVIVTREQLAPFYYRNDVFEILPAPDGTTPRGTAP